MATGVKVTGNPQVLGADGKPIPGAPTLDAQGNIEKGSGTQQGGSYVATDTSGTPLRSTPVKSPYSTSNVPPGSVYAPDGSITAPDGTVIQGPTSSAPGGGAATGAASTGIPRVTPTPENGQPVNYSETPSPASIPAAPTEDQSYAALLNKSRGLITSTEEQYKQELDKASGQTAAEAAAAGLGGSSAYTGMDQAAAAPILAQRDKDLAAIYQQIEQEATTQNQQDFNQTEALKQDSIAAAATSLTNATNAVKTMAANHVDWNAYKQTNPQNYNALVQALGGDPNVADALFASNIPPQTVQQTWVTGSTFNQLTTDPVTGKPSIQSYDLGVKIPQNWTSDKIGTNAVVYHGPNWDPTDPSTYQMFAVDPATGLPTSQVGGSANPSAPADPNKVTTAVTNVATAAGITDPGIALSDAINLPGGVTAIVNGIISNEGSSPDGVKNNPGNIKFAGLPGQTDSGVKATDGGTFANYASVDAGKNAIANMITNAATGKSPAYGSKPTFTSFINKYTGQGAPSNKSTAAIPANIQAYADAVTAGNATLAQVPIAQRTAVAEALDQGSVKYSPIAASRLTTASNKITSPYTNMSAYALTANGLPYLARIQAAEQNPGSISDQDLLDSLTKLNNGDAAISDAQVKVITDGQSYADMASVLGNKLKNGGVLSDDQRTQIQTIAKAIYANYQKIYQPIYNKATAQLTAAGIPKAFWTIPDLNDLSASSGIDTGQNDTSQNQTPTDAPTDDDTALLEDNGFTDNGDGTWSAPGGAVYSWSGTGWTPQ